MSRWPVTAAVLVFVAAAAFAQSSRFQPGANPISNQGYDAAALLVGTAIQATRAIYNGNATACNFTVTMNGGGSVQLQNNQPGTYNPIQAVIVTASTCSAGALIAIW
jgi:hypothetical protein